MRAFFLLFLLFFHFFSHTNASDRKVVYAFKSATDLNHIKMTIIGETISIEKASVFETKPEYNMMNLDIRPDTVTIKVLYNPGIRVGQILYLLEKNPNHDAYKDGNIVGQVKVVSIYKTSFFGERLRGEGYLRLIENKPMTVAMEVHSAKRQDAIIVKKQGDYFARKGDVANAILSYKKAIKLVPQYPDAHHALALLHNTKGEGYISAGFEFLQAWKHRSKFREKNDKFRFYIDYIRYLNQKFERESGVSAGKDLAKAITVFKEARRIHAKDYHLNASIAHTYFLCYENPMSCSTKWNSTMQLGLRDTKDAFLTKAKKHIETALRIRKEDYLLQRLAVLVYFESYKPSINIGRKTESKRQESGFLKKKIIRHLNFYAMYIPETAPRDSDMARIRDIMTQE
ncbi:MAG: tetratricopeptide repeat protein [Spirochaetota bacterium]